MQDIGAIDLGGAQKMSKTDGFYTLKGYAILANNTITYSMEDYLEMIYRMHLKGETVRIGRLAEQLHVKPSSASKMVDNLSKQNLVDAPKYGFISLTLLGKELGAYLVFRHETLHQLLCYINQSDCELEQVEKIEHFINPQTVNNIALLLAGLNRKPT